jgi:hypothetical protein
MEFFAQPAIDSTLAWREPKVSERHKLGSAECHPRS